MEPPRKPDESECCNSGCNPCIFDVYERQLKKYLDQPYDKVPITNCIDELTFTQFKLTQVIPQCGDVNIYIFSHPDESAHLYFNPGQHFLIRSYSKCDQIYFTKAYTPIPYGSLKLNQFAIIVRLYQIGEMSNYFKRLKLNSLTDWRGPYGDYIVNNAKYMFFIAQGTGIAPIYAVIKSLLDNEECESWIKLFYCCRGMEGILLRNELQDCGAYWNFSVELFVGDVDGEAKYNEVVHKRRLNADDINRYIDGKSSVDIAICGNDLFSECIKGYVGASRIKESNVFIF